MWHGNCINASCVHWQLSSKLPTAFDSAFQTDFISQSGKSILDFFRERWQRIPRSYFPFGALIINRTILLLLFFFFFFLVQYFPTAVWEAQYVVFVGSATQDWMAGSSYPSSSSAIKTRPKYKNYGAGWTHQRLSHPSCCPRINHLSLCCLWQKFA